MAKAFFSARIGYQGQEFYALDITTDQIIGTENIKVENNIIDLPDDRYLAKITNRTERPVTEVICADGVAHIELVPISVRCPDFKVIVNGVEYNASNTEVRTEWADRFDAVVENGVRYRLYSPEIERCRPLILHLHGGGPSGTDNIKPLFHCFGAAKLAESYPDCYVMVPQAPHVNEAAKVRGNPMAMTFNGATTNNGWTREYLTRITDLIRKWIGEGKVDPQRVYVTGLSMGGAGTLKAMSVAPNLFAAAVCICPTMFPETYNILKGLTHSKIWVACSYLDHTPYRHKYLVDGVMSLIKAGNKDAYLTMFSPEELAKYNIGIDPEQTLEQKASANHWCWVPTYCDEHGIMSWMIDQTKD